MNQQERDSRDYLEVKHSDIRASATSDTLPEYGCDHRVVAWFTVSFIETLIEQGYFVFCPKCGEKL